MTSPSEPNVLFPPAEDVPLTPSDSGESTAAEQKTDYLDCSFEEIVRSVYEPLKIEMPPLDLLKENSDSTGSADSEPETDSEAEDAISLDETANPFDEVVTPNPFLPISKPSSDMSSFFDTPSLFNPPAISMTDAPQSDDADTDAIPQNKMPIPRCVPCDDVPVEPAGKRRLRCLGNILLGVLVVVLAVCATAFLIWKMNLLPSTLLDTVGQINFLPFDSLIPNA